MSSDYLQVVHYQGKTWLELRRPNLHCARLTHKRVATDVNTIGDVERIDVPSFRTLLITQLDDMPIGLEFQLESVFRAPSVCLVRIVNAYRGNSMQDRIVDRSNHARNVLS
jgi:hypothetical protein